MNGNPSYRGGLPVSTTPPEANPMNALDRLRTQSLASTGGRTPNLYPLVGRCIDFAREEEIRKATNLKRPTAIVPRRTLANDPAGPPIDTNLTQLTSGADGKLDTSEWMHSWFGHSCGCGEEGAEEVKRVNGRQV